MTGIEQGDYLSLLAEGILDSADGHRSALERIAVVLGRHADDNDALIEAIVEN